MVDADQVITDLTEIFRRTLVDPNFTPTRDMKTGDHPKWDSYANVEILVSCEEHWDFELEPSEIVLVKTFGDMVDVITFKLN